MKSVLYELPLPDAICDLIHEYRGIATHLIQNAELNLKRQTSRAVESEQSSAQYATCATYSNSVWSEEVTKIAYRFDGKLVVTKKIVTEYIGITKEKEDIMYLVPCRNPYSSYNACVMIDACTCDPDSISGDLVCACCTLN